MCDIRSGSDAASRQRPSSNGPGTEHPFGSRREKHTNGKNISRLRFSLFQGHPATLFRILAPGRFKKLRLSPHLLIEQSILPAVRPVPGHPFSDFSVYICRQTSKNDIPFQKTLWSNDTQSSEIRQPTRCHTGIGRKRRRIGKHLAIPIHCR